MTLKITKDRVVRLFYQLQEQDGSPLESSDNQVPMAYLHGHDNFLSALEAALEGLQAGDRKQITLTPEQAFGSRSPDAVHRVPIKHLLSQHKRLRPGTLVKVQTDRGAMSGTAVKVGKFTVDVDFNHPFAGKTLVFDIAIESVRDATSEELAHGHAHGEGGHRH